jgi:hypothetical protein
MEAERVALDLEGVCFRYYRCPRCGHDHVFLEVVPVLGESDKAFQDRRNALSAAAKEAQVNEATIFVVEQGCCAWEQTA